MTVWRVLFCSARASGLFYTTDERLLMWALWAQSRPPPIFANTRSYGFTVLLWSEPHSSCLLYIQRTLKFHTWSFRFSFGSAVFFPWNEQIRGNVPLTQCCMCCRGFPRIPLYIHIFCIIISNCIACTKCTILKCNDGCQRSSTLLMMLCFLLSK